jgi:hypothetical protein
MDHLAQETTTRPGSALYGALWVQSGICFDGSRGLGGALCDAGRDRQFTEVDSDNPVRMGMSLCHIDLKST